MRLSVLLVAVLGLTTISVFPLSKVFGGSLKTAGEDLNEFAALIPIQSIENIYQEYLAKDREVQALLKHFLSQDPQSEISAVGNANFAYIDFLNRIHKADLELYTKIEALYIFLALEEFGRNSASGEKFTDRNSGIAGGVSGLFDEIKSLISHSNDLHKLYETKLQTSYEFRNVVADLRTGNFDSFIAALKSNEK